MLSRAQQLSETIIINNHPKRALSPDPEISETRPQDRTEEKKVEGPPYQCYTTGPRDVKNVEWVGLRATTTSTPGPGGGCHGSHYYPRGN